MRNIASGLTHLSAILEDLSEVLEEGRRKNVYRPRVLERTETILHRFRDVQEKIEKILKKQGGLRGRLGWVLKSEKVFELVGEIESLKSAMNLVLWTVHFAMERKKAGGVVTGR
jgi:hypothetical protein